MALNSLWTLLEHEVSGVSGVQSSIHAGYSRYPIKKHEVSGVSGDGGGVASDTPDTSEEIAGYQRKAAPILACTPDTLDTPEKINTGANAANCPAIDSPTPPAIDIGTRRPPDLSPTLLAASLALDAQIAASGALPVDPDRHCYPHTEAMNGAELALMATRLERFARIGLPVDQAEKLADRLKDRDRDPQDDRRICLECLHCQYGRCGNVRAAGLRQPELGTDYTLVLKRCCGFSEGTGTLAGSSLTFSSLPPSKPLPRPHQGHPLTPEQQQAGRSYHEHHFGCPKCRSGRGDRCQRGAELWNKYQEGTTP